MIFDDHSYHKVQFFLNQLPEETDESLQQWHMAQEANSHTKNMLVKIFLF